MHLGTYVFFGVDAIGHTIEVHDAFIGGHLGFGTTLCGVESSIVREAMGQFPGRDSDDVDSTRPCLILVREAFSFQKTSQFSIDDDISYVARLTRNEDTSVHSRACNLLAGYETITFLVSAMAIPKVAANKGVVNCDSMSNRIHSKKNIGTQMHSIQSLPPRGTKQRNSISHRSERENQRE